MIVTTRTGAKIRCESHRRYFVIAEYPNVEAPVMLRRTDSLETAKQVAARFRKRDGVRSVTLWDSASRTYVLT